MHIEYPASYRPTSQAAQHASATAAAAAPISEVPMNDMPSSRRYAQANRSDISVARHEFRIQFLSEALQRKTPVSKRRAAEAVGAAFNCMLRAYKSSDDNSFLGKCSSDEAVRRFLEMMAYEGSGAGTVVNYSTLKVELTQMLTSMENSLTGVGEHGTDEDKHAKAFLQWWGSEMGDVFNRSTAADCAGKSVRSQESSNMVDNLNAIKLGQIMHPGSLKVTEIPVRQPTQEEIEAEAPQFQLEDAVMRYMSVDVEKAAQLSAKHVQFWQRDTAEADVEQLWEHETKMAELGRVDQIPDWAQTESMKWLYWGLHQDAYTCLLCIYPRAAGKITVAGMTFDLDSLLLAAAVDIEHMLAEHIHPAGVCTKALLDSLDFRRKGVAAALVWEGDTPLGNSGHGAKKTQRLYSRPLEIQHASQRLCQSLHQDLPRHQHPANLTAAAGSEVAGMIRRFGAAQEVGNAPGPANGSRESMKQPDAVPSISILTLISREQPEYDVAAEWESLGAALRSGACMLAAMSDTRLEGVNCRDGAAYMKKMADRMEQHEGLNEKYRSRFVATMNALEVCELAKGCVFREIHRINSGAKYLAEEMKEQLLPGHELFLREDDSAAFTPAGMMGMFTFLLYNHRRDFIGTGYLHSVYNLINFLTVRRAIFSMDMEMTDGAKRHSGNCSCMKPDVLRSIYGPEIYAKLGISEDRFFGMGNGSSSQGLDAPNSTEYVLHALTGMHRPQYVGINGDDQIGALVAATHGRIWQRLIKELPPEAAMLLERAECLQIGSQLDKLVCMGNLYEGNFGTSADFASGSLRPSTKKCSHGTGVSTDPAATVVYKVSRSRKAQVLETRGPGMAAVVGAIAEKSLAAFTSHILRTVHMTALAEGSSARLVQNVLACMHRYLPAVADTVTRVAGFEVKSIWSGSKAVLGDVKLALREVFDDPLAPDFAKEYAAKGLLILPKGPRVRAKYRETDFLAKWLTVLQGKNLALANALSYRQVARTVSYAEWLSGGGHMALPELDPAEYMSAQALNARSSNVEPVVINIVSGDAMPGMPCSRLGKITLKPYPGGSMYRPVAPETSPGMVLSSIDLPGGIVQYRMLPVWPELTVSSAGSVQISTLRDPYGGSIPAALRLQVDFANHVKAELGNTLTLEGELTMNRDVVNLKYSTDHLGSLTITRMAQAVLEYCAPRLQMQTGRIYDASIKKRAQPGVLLGSGEVPVGWKARQGFYYGKATYQIRARVFVPPMARSGEVLNRSNVESLINARRRAPAAHVRYSHVNPDEAEVASARGDSLAWDSDDLNFQPRRNLVSISAMVLGTECTVQYTPLDLQTALEMDEEHLAMSTVAVASILKKTQSNKNGEWQISLPGDFGLMRAVEYVIRGGDSPKLMKDNVEVGRITSLESFYGALLCRMVIQ